MKWYDSELLENMFGPLISHREAGSLKCFSQRRATQSRLTLSPWSLVLSEPRRCIFYFLGEVMLFLGEDLLSIKVKA